MRWLHELINKIYRFRLIFSIDLTSSCKHIICLLATVLLVSIICYLSYYSTFFLLYYHENCKSFYCNTRCPFCKIVYIAIVWFVPPAPQCYQYHISCIKTPCYHICLSNLSYLYQRCNESHLFMFQR